MRLAVVQEVLSPVRRPVFDIMAQRDDIELKLFVLTEDQPNRPGWVVNKNESFEVERLNSIRMKGWMKTPGGGTAFDYRNMSIHLSWCIAKWQPDVVLFGGLTQLLLLSPLKLFRGTPFVLGVADTQLTAAQYPVWKQRLRAFAFRRADTFVPYGTAAMRYLHGIGVPDDRMFHGMWSVDNDRYGRSEALNPSLPCNPNQWISVGQLVERKGFQELIQAWAAQGEEFCTKNHLWIVGEGPRRHELQKQIDTLSLSGKISLLGQKSGRELSQLYQRSNVFVLPTLMDHWGLVVNEAMAAGLPILCSKYAGCHADLVRPENGALFDPLSPQGFAAALADFRSRRRQWSELGAASRRIIAPYTVVSTANAMTDAAHLAVREPW